MNRTKRTLELIAAVFSIVLGAFLTLGSLLILVGISSIEQSNDYLVDPAAAEIVKVVAIFVLLGSIAIIVVASLLAPSPIKKGKLSHSFGLQLALAILVGVVAILELLGGSIVWFLIFIVPLVLIIISMCIKD